MLAGEAPASLNGAAPESMERALVAVQLLLEPAGIGARREGDTPVLIGFALETVAADALAEVARGKLRRKGVDMVVANRAADAFDRDDNIAMIVTEQDVTALPKMSKTLLADRILDQLVARWTEPEQSNG